MVRSTFDTAVLTPSSGTARKGQQETGTAVGESELWAGSVASLSRQLSLQIRPLRRVERALERRSESLARLVKAAELLQKIAAQGVVERVVREPPRARKRIEAREAGGRTFDMGAGDGFPHPKHNEKPWPPAVERGRDGG